MEEFEDHMPRSLREELRTTSAGMVKKKISKNTGRLWVTLGAQNSILHPEFCAIGGILHPDFSPYPR